MKIVNMGNTRKFGLVKSDGDQVTRNSWWNFFVTQLCLFLFNGLFIFKYYFECSDKAIVRL